MVKLPWTEAMFIGRTKCLPIAKKVKKIVLANRRITAREVAEDLNISIGSSHSILTNDFGMTRVDAKFVPKLLR